MCGSLEKNYDLICAGCVLFVRVFNTIYCYISTVRLQSSGATFRGLAVQVREATASFTNDAAFVGEFVNPPVDGDWRIWNCAAVSYFIKRS